LIILYQKIINILLLRVIEQASWTIQFSQQASEHKRNGVAGKIAMRGGYIGKRSIKNTKSAVNF